MHVDVTKKKEVIYMYLLTSFLTYLLYHFEKLYR